MEIAFIIAVSIFLGFIGGRITLRDKKEFVDDREDFKKICKYCKKKFATCYDTIDECNQCSDRGWID